MGAENTEPRGIALSGWRSGTPSAIPRSRQPVVFSTVSPRDEVAGAVKVLTDRLTESPTEHRFSVTPAWWQERCGGDAELAEGIRGGLEIRIRIHRMSEDLYLEGELQGTLELTCGRCLTRYREPARERFRLVLEPAGSRVPADPEGAEALVRDGVFLSDELESGWFRGSEIDLGSLFQQVIALAFPVQPVCREDCRGLCARCGADRNAESCNCSEVRPESPFAALRALRDGLRRGTER
jgi:uncharacterized protein